MAYNTKHVQEYVIIGRARWPGDLWPCVSWLQWFVLTRPNQRDRAKQKGILRGPAGLQRFQIKCALAWHEDGWGWSEIDISSNFINESNLFLCAARSLGLHWKHSNCEHTKEPKTVHHMSHHHYWSVAETPFEIFWINGRTGANTCDMSVYATRLDLCSMGPHELTVNAGCLTRTLLLLNICVHRKALQVATFRLWSYWERTKDNFKTLANKINTRWTTVRVERVRLHESRAAFCATRVWRIPAHYWSKHDKQKCKISQTDSYIIVSAYHLLDDPTHTHTSIQ